MIRLGLFKSAALACTAALILANPLLAKPQYGATAPFAKNFNPATVKPYTWTPARPATDKAIDAKIMAAVDKELASVGLQPSTGGPGDVLVTYYSISRTDVDVKAKPDEKGLRPEHTVGSLVVALLDPASRKPVVQLRIDKPIE